jgi:hypothetical protein
MTPKPLHQHLTRAFERQCVIKSSKELADFIEHDVVRIHRQDIKLLKHRLRRDHNKFCATLEPDYTFVKRILRHLDLSMRLSIKFLIGSVFLLFASVCAKSPLSPVTVAMKTNARVAASATAAKPSAGLPKGLKLLIGAGGIYSAFLYYGTLQEDVFRYKAPDGSSFKSAWFLQAMGRSDISFNESTLNILLHARIFPLFSIFYDSFTYLFHGICVYTLQRLPQTS